MPGDQGKRRMRVKGSEARAGDRRRGTVRPAGRSWAPSRSLPCPGSPRREENRPEEPLGGRSGIRGGRCGRRRAPGVRMCGQPGCWGVLVQLQSPSLPSGTRAWSLGLLGRLEPLPCRLRRLQIRMALWGSLLMTAGHRA